MSEKLTYEELEQRVQELEMSVSENKLEEQVLQKAHDKLELKIKERTIKLQKELQERRRVEDDLIKINKNLDKTVQERTEELRQLSKQLIYSDEQNRHKLASDLHDGLGQTLALTVSKIKGIKESCSLENLVNLSEVQEYLELSIREIRLLIHELYPPILNDFDISIALGYLIEESNKNSNVKISYINNIDDPVHLAEANKIFLYRSVNELIKNCLKHSGSKKTTIELSKKKDTLLVKFEDNGIGFNPSSIGSSGFGLFSLTEQLKMMDGKIEIESEINKGTKIQLGIPIN